MLQAGDELKKSKDLCLEIRKLIQEISQETDVEIEPASCTNLLDTLLKLPEVYYAAVPGGNV